MSPRLSALARRVRRALGGALAARPAPSRAVLEELEPRLLYSADSPGAWLGAAVVAPLQRAAPAAEAAPADSRAAPAAAALRHEIVFVDPAVPDAAKLLDALRADGDATRRLEVVLLDGSRDGVAQIGQALAGRSSIDAVHVLSHGAAGVLQLGSTRLDAGALQARAGEVAAWGAALAADADLLLYGCDLAADDAGRALVTRLARLTGADVAASENATGSALLGGDWALEYTTGRIESASSLGAQAQHDWTGLLAIAVGNTSSSMTTGASSLSFAHTVASGSNRVLVVTVSLLANSGSIGSVSYGGAALTLLGTAENPGGNNARAEIWLLKAPIVGTANVVIGTSASMRFTAGATSFTGVDQTTPTSTFVGGSGSGHAPSLTVTSEADELVIDSVADRAGASGSVGANQTERYRQLTGTSGGDVLGASSTEAGAASVTMSWSLSGSGSGEWAAAAVSLRPAANVAPVVATSGGSLAYTENAAATAIDGGLTVSDADSPNLSGATVSISGNFAAGEDVLAFSTQNGISGSFDAASGVLTLAGSATVAQYQAALRSVTYVNTSDAPSTAARTVSFVVSDGSLDSNTAARGITVAAVNDAPLLPGANNLAAINRNPVSNPGTLVADLIRGQVSDTDGSTLAGIAVHAVDNSNGVWQFSTNGGAGWTAFGSPSVALSRLLAADTETYVRFVPNSNWSGSVAAGLSFRAWDQSGGALAGSTASTASSGGSTPFSAATASAGIVVTASNTAPTLAVANAVATIAEDAVTNAGTLVSALVAGQVSDPDPLADAGIAVTAVDNSQGSWQYSLNGGGLWTDFDAPSVSAARLLAADADTRVRFVPAANWNGTLAAGLTFRAWDQSSGVAGGTADTSGTSGTYLDTFATGNYSGSQGTLAWHGDWVESDSSGGAAASGRFRVNNGALQVEVAQANDHLSRRVDLSGAGSATLSFTFQSGLGGAAVLQVQASNNGGASYTTLPGGVFSGAANNGNGSLSLDLTPYISADTRIRLFVASGANGAGNNSLKIDNVQISASGGSGGTTAFSTAIASAALTVSAVNDAPVRSAGTVANLVVAEDAAATSLGLGALAYGPGGGSDEAGQTLGYTVTAVPSAALGSITLADGSTLVSAGASYSLAQLQGMMFRAAPDAVGGPATFGWSVVDNGGTSGGGFDTRVESLTVTVTAVNDAPRLLTTDPSLAYPIGTGVAVIDPGLSLVDVDHATLSGAVVTIAGGYVSGQDLLGFSNQNGISGSWNAGGGVLTLSGSATVAQYEAALRSVSFQTAATTAGSRQISLTASDGSASSNPAGKSVLVGQEVAALWLSAKNTGVTSAGTGALTYSDGQIARLSGPNLALGAGTSNGSFTSVFNIDSFALDGNADINGLHYVNATVTVGTTNAVTLQRGDVLFTTGGSDTLGGVAVTKDDVVLFRPTAPGNYSAGSFSVLLRNPGGTGAGVRDFALVETPMTVAGTALQAGDFLLVLGGGSYDKDIQLFRPTTMATSPTGGALTLLVDGNGSTGMGLLARQIYGLDLVQQNTTLGGVSLTQGQLLMTVNGVANVAGNGLAVTAFDVFVLTVTATGNTTSAGTAAMLLRGSDVGLSAGGEEHDALATVAAFNSAPVLDASRSPVLSAVAEDAGMPVGAVGTLVSALVDFASPAGQVDNITDADANAQLGIAVIAADTSQGRWWFSTDGGTNWTALGSVADGGARLLAADAGTRLHFQPNPDWNGTLSSAITFRAWDRSSFDNGALVSTTTNGSFSAFSSATDIAALTVTAVNDAPVLADRALAFDGVDDRVVIDDAASLRMSTAMTMEAWVRREGTPTGTQIILNKEGEYELGITSAGVLQWAFANTTPGWNWVPTGVVLPAEQWAHVAVSFDAGQVKSYVNGVLAHAFAGSGSIGDAYPALNTLTIGGRENATTQRFQGSIDEVRIWNLARSAAEIAAARTQTLGGAETGLVGYWRFAEGSGTVATDSSPQGNHGVLGNGVAGEVPARLFAYTLAEDASLAVAAPGVLARASDAEGSALTAVLVSGPASAASFTLNADGSFSYVPLANFHGVDSFVFKASDGALDSQPATVTLNVSAVNDAPVLGTTGSALAYTENDPATAIDTGLTLVDVDSTHLSGATVSITANHASGQDLLSFVDQNGISGSWNAGTGVLTLSGSATVAHYQAALRSVAYRNSSDTPSTATRSLSFVVNDGVVDSNTATRQITVAAVNDPPTGVPTVDGAATRGQMLSVSTAGLGDADGLGAFSVQWLRDGSPVPGATATTYLLGVADVGTRISVQVSYTDGQGTAEGPVSSAQTALVTNVNTAPTGLPVITGSATEDQTLSADTSGIADADGLGAFSYQWLRGGTPVPGATGSSYLLGDADVGAQINVQVRYTDGLGTDEGPLSSAPTAAVANVNDAPTGVPTITGTASRGQTLTAATAGIADVDGLGAFGYQWLRNGAPIGGATGSSYLLGVADIGAAIRVQVTYTDGRGTAEGPLISAPTAAVTNVNTAPTGVPVMTGSATEDQVLNADTSGIADADGLGAFTYQWLRSGTPVSGATAATYTLGDDDVGTQISVQVRYTDGLGTVEGPLTSAQTAAVANVNDAPTGVPTISGTASRGQTLTASTAGITDADGLGAFAYQWQRDGAPVAGATGSSYLLGAADVGTSISVQVSYTDGQGTAEGPLTSTASAAVTNVNIAPTGVPTITGSATEDQTLSADTSGIADADGLGAFSYQWLRSGTPVSGATAATYTLGDDDVGTQISVQVRYTDGLGTVEGPLTSAQTAAVANVNDAPTGVPTISGTASRGQTLTASTAGITDADGLGAFAYQWQRDGAPVAGATGSSYLLGAADVGTSISVQVSYTDGQGTAEGPLTSTASAAVTNVNIAPTGVPTITGSATEDQVLSADTSGIADADGLGAFSYQWLRGGTPVSGATGSSYLLGDDDVGSQISVQVRYTDGLGTAEGPLTSDPTAAVANVNDAPTGVPTISGTASRGQTLTASTAGITDADGLGAFAYQWQRDGAPVAGATGSSYLLGAADVGTSISVQVSYTDGHGTAEGPLTSTATAAVTNVNTAPTGLPTITGTASRGQTLMASTAGITDADGLGAFAYQWQRNGAPVAGATGSSYLLGAADVGAVIRVQVSYTDGQGTGEGPLLSAATAAVTNVNSAPTGAPAVVGTPLQGQTLVADTSGIADADGLGAFSYQWLRGGVAVTGATASSYLLGAADVGAAMSVQLRFTDALGTAEGPLVSAATAPVAALNSPALGAPAVAGTASRGQTLTALGTGISDTDGLGAFNHQWLRDGAAIAGATGSSYLLGVADVGARISVQVSFTDGRGNAEGPLVSAATAPVSAANTPATGVPVIAGSAKQGQSLSVDTGGVADADGLGVFSLQWLRDGAPVAGAVGGSYLLGGADVGRQLSVELRFTDALGTAEGPLVSAATEPVSALNRLPTGAPVVGGLAVVGQTLSADATGIADADGLGPFAYQWQRDGVPVAGATGIGYLLGSADLGARITVEVRFTDALGSAEGPLVSAASDAVKAQNRPATGQPSIAGDAVVGATLTASTTAIGDADGLGPFSLQWLRDGVPVAGATGSSYLLGSADLGARIGVQVSFSDGRGHPEGPLVATMAEPVAAANSPSTGAPAIVGGATVGQPLIADTRGIADADGLGPFAFQWLRNGQPIEGATGDRYTPGAADLGARLAVVVQYTDGAGRVEGPLVSATTAPVAPAGSPLEIVSDGGGPAATLATTEGRADLTTVQSRGGAEGHRFSVAGGADRALFTIDPNSGALRWLVAPDFEAPADSDADNRYRVMVQVSDPTGAVAVQDLTIVVGNVNEAPAGGDGLRRLDEDQPLVLSVADFGFRDPDAGDALGAVRIDSPPAAGRLLLGGAPVAVGQRIDAADLAAGRLVYTPPLDAHGEGLAQLVFTVADAQGLFALQPSTLRLDVAPLPDAPRLAADLGLSVAEGEGATIDGTMLRGTAPDATPAQIRFTVGSATVHGRLELSGAPGQPVSAFTQADVDAGRLRYVHDGSETTADRFVFDLTGPDGLVLGGVTFTIAVQPVDDAPALELPAVQTLRAGGGAQPLGLRAAIVDPDSALLMQAVIRLEAGGSAGGALVLAGSHPVSAVWDAQRGTLTLSGPASPAQYATALGAVQWVGESVATGARVYSVTVTDDSGTPSAPVIGTLRIAAPAPAPAPGPAPAPAPAPAAENRAAPAPAAVAVAAAPAAPASAATEPRAPAAAERPLSASPVAADAPAALALPPPLAARGEIPPPAADGARSSETVLPRALQDLLPPAPVNDADVLDALEALLSNDPRRLDSGASGSSRGGAIEVRALIENGGTPAPGDEGGSFDVLAQPGVGGGLLLSASVLWWATRAGGLMAAMMASLPAWRSFDPLPILDRRRDRAADDGDAPGFDDAPEPAPPPTLAGERGAPPAVPASAWAEPAAPAAGAPAATGRGPVAILEEMAGPR